ncbi:hypothetical protein AcW1_006835 [Taiwanofungus camphoratus]|nr:hypothetical protein AcW1_006835 [Antrodia cinnamomea]
MPPQPGVFTFPYAPAHKARTANITEMVDIATLFHPAAGPSSRTPGASIDEPKKDKRKREVVGKLGKEMIERRDDVGRHYTEIISDLHSTSIQLSTRPETLPAYNLRLYSISLERSALLASLALQEKLDLECVQIAYDEEREKVEEEWKRGRDRIRERLLEGIEERRRRAREEKDGEGTVIDAGLDSQSRTHNTRKLRNKLGGTSPPPTPLSANAPTNRVMTSITSGPVTSGPLPNPHSLSVDELPSPFPLPLTSTHLTHTSNYGYNGGGGAGSNSRRRAKGGGRETQAVGGLGKSLVFISSCKEQEIEHDLIEIRRGNKRRRVAATSLVGKG